MGTRQVDLKALLESRMENIEPAEGSRASIESAERTLCMMLKALYLSRKRSLYCQRQNR